ncbi:acyl-CoA dehydrogenase family protein [Sulfitobacter pseudonitzschiae]|uniref:Acyl-CoA dehydrogenase family protein n=1 Tax=Pseudosulfitobacter pseudonitzschiae TaxID=1402135 RepID=A0A9Q2NJ32_9RHOB|nr:acyl-CoA dehydrogenase family protein [Pseudosulfitobacter pseudonitzschiae]MBM2292926.1 acyl-CoA dehydrogenase family protein [Pseudosulfitobacter pseudonitzschiae]MBM2297786.1 acyl-CoA dehydrogenase family protein [Pseudosulfitobacter pseudonitzschiae]MBM2302700.1 acyl-CoA dehydrogenase family protein [Pseudosulfitobacter pseudonitzschiae]MBM2312310.1 acyl-CoA dehydrogenase family protein [Pseudosulfitobacter pseudonitzschiae]MBM2317396.1 acyl-CoA dehydrogenase family protein [Pseudosulfi
MSFTLDNTRITDRALDIANRVETFVRETIAPYEKDTRKTSHGPTDALAIEMKAKARDAGVLTPHILGGGDHLTHLETAAVLIRSGLSPLGPVACNVAAPDEGNMYLLGKEASPELKERFLEPMVRGEMRSAFFMTEPAEDGGAGSDPMMMQTTCKMDGNHWVINGRKTYITGAEGAGLGIVMAKSDDGACMFLVDLPDPAIRIERVMDTIDSSMPGGHAVISIDNLRVPASQMLGQSGEGFGYAQVRLSPARLTHCMRWLGACIRANEIASDYANRRMAFGKPLVDHEGVGFMLAENLIDLKQAELMIYWCADILDTGVLGTAESSMTKVAVSEALMRVADRCVQVMGGQGVTQDTIVEQVFREIRAFRIYDGPTEVHKWSLAKKIKRDWKKAQDL